MIIDQNICNNIIRTLDAKLHDKQNNTLEINICNRNFFNTKMLQQDKYHKKQINIKYWYECMTEKINAL